MPNPGRPPPPIGVTRSTHPAVTSATHAATSSTASTFDVIKPPSRGEGPGHYRMTYQIRRRWLARGRGCPLEAKPERDGRVRPGAVAIPSGDRQRHVAE